DEAHRAPAGEERWASSLGPPYGPCLAGCPPVVGKDARQTADRPRQPVPGRAKTVFATSRGPDRPTGTRNGAKSGGGWDCSPPPPPGVMPQGRPQGAADPPRTLVATA